MLAILSPAKTLQMDIDCHCDPASDPVFTKDASELIKTLKQSSAKQISQLMKLSDKLTELNMDRYNNWSLKANEENARQVIYAFQGDVYQGLDASSLDKRTVKYANKHLRILSGLYGLLKPLDWLQAYRLEMGTSLKNPRGKDLYAFWGDKIAKQLDQDLKSAKAAYLINLASKEYFKSVALDAISVPVIEPVFKDEKNGQFKIISFYAKKARGLMARYLMLNRVNTMDELMAFDLAGYKLDKKLSSETQPVFKRTEKAALRFKDG